MPRRAWLVIIEFGLALAEINGALLSTVFNQFAPSFRRLVADGSIGAPSLKLAVFRRS